MYTILYIFLTVYIYNYIYTIIGGALSLFTGLQLPLELKPAGILVMSGYIPGIL